MPGLPQLPPSTMIEQTKRTDPTPQLDPALGLNQDTLAQPNISGDQIPGVEQALLKSGKLDKKIPRPFPGLVAATGGVPSSKLMKAELDRMIAVLNAKAKSVKGSIAQNQQVALANKQKALGLFFDILKQAGVDPNNLQSLSEFIQKLENTDPDLAILFERAFDSLVGAPQNDATPTPTSVAPVSGGPMTGGPTSGPIQVPPGISDSRNFLPPQPPIEHIA